MKHTVIAIDSVQKQFACWWVLIDCRPKTDSPLPDPHLSPQQPIWWDMRACKGIASKLNAYVHMFLIRDGPLALSHYCLDLESAFCPVCANNVNLF